MGRIQTFATELRRRRVFRAAGIYVVAAWVAVQVASLILPAIDIADSAIRFIWLIVVFLFPLALIFAWYFEVTSSGIQRTPPTDVGEMVDLSLRPADRVVLSALLVIGLAVTWQLSLNIRDYALSSQGASIAGAGPNSIAVLPLVNSTGDAEQEYFVAGMHEALISGLSRNRALRVTSKTSTMRFGDASEALPEIAGQLKVAKLIEGSVNRSGNLVRISVQLVDAAQDRQVWSDVFEDDITEVLRLQSDVARAIANQIQDVVSDGRGTTNEVIRTVDPAAYEAYLKGQFHVERFTPQDMQIAAQYYQQAVDLDPDNALAHYGLSKLCGFQAQAGIITPEQAWDRCLPPIMHALELYPDLPEAHMGYAAHMTWQRFDWEEAGKGFERAIELNPSYAEARMFYSHYLALMGRTLQSSEQMRRALELDPFNPFVRGLYGAQLLMIGDYQGCVDVIEEVMRTTPGFAFGYNTMWKSYFELGDYDKALSAAANFYRLTQGDPTGADALEEAYRDGDYQSAMLHAAAVLEEHSQNAHVAPMFIGFMYEQAGNYEKAIEWYEIAYEKHDPDAPYIAVITTSPGLHSHPRFIQLLQNMKHYYWAGLYSQVPVRNQASAMPEN
jgi:TolB-like protein/cytochrome c-type biogenesis protein CcmH/NrfG